MSTIAPLNVELVVDSIRQRDDEIQTRLQRRPVTPEALNVVAARLWHDPHSRYHQKHQQSRHDDDRD
jgi:hypothetical protein